MHTNTASVTSIGRVCYYQVLVIKTLLNKIVKIVKIVKIAKRIIVYTSVTRYNAYTLCRQLLCDVWGNYYIGPDDTSDVQFVHLFDR